jgi:hypothetical protein
MNICRKCGSMEGSSRDGECKTCQIAELRAEVARLRADRRVLDGRVMVAETMLADFYHRAKDTDRDQRSPIDSPPPIVLVRHIIWQYETVMKVATLGKTTDASGVLGRVQG